MILRTATNMQTQCKVCTTKAGTEFNSHEQHSFVLTFEFLNYFFPLQFSASFTEYIASLAWF